MRKVLEGSRIDRGRKNRRNMKKQVARNPATLAQTIRRRILLTGAANSQQLHRAVDDGTRCCRRHCSLRCWWRRRRRSPCRSFHRRPPVFVLDVLELSTNPNLRQSGSATWVGSKCCKVDTRLLPMQSELYNSPQGRELSLPSGSDFRVNIKSSAPKDIL